MPSADRKGESVADSQLEPGRAAQDPARESREPGREHGNTNGHGASTPSPSIDAGWDGLDDDVADRYALSFRPSWSPLDGSEPKSSPAAVPQYLSLRSGPPANGPNAHDAALERPVRLAVPGKRSSARLVAVLSIAGFLLLTYWGVSTTAKPGAARPVASKPVAARSAVEAPPQPSATDAVAPNQAFAKTANAAAAATQDAPPTTVEAQPAAADSQPTAAANPGADTQPLAAANEPPSAAAPAATTPPPSAATPSAVIPPPSAAPSNANELAASAHAADTAAVAANVGAAAATSSSPQPTAANAAPSLAADSNKPAAEKTDAHPVPPSAANSTLATAPLHARSPVLAVRAVPDSARLWLDGQRMANPFDARIDRNTKHRIEARSEGYETITQNVRIESDAKLTITLRASPEVHDPQLKTPSSNATPRPRGAGFVSVSPY
jgi:hypothetical protein